MIRLVVDLGNSRLKWAIVDKQMQIDSLEPILLDQSGDWVHRFRDHLHQGLRRQKAEIAIASVNPPMAGMLRSLFSEDLDCSTRWFESAASIAVSHSLETPERVGVDRALGVLSALKTNNHSGPLIVVQCGTAITVDRVAPEGRWTGGAIGIGLETAARALVRATAQLPPIELRDRELLPPPWGTRTVTAIEAGVFWGTVGAVRELIDQQATGLPDQPQIIMTGGNAKLIGEGLKRSVAIDPELVLKGLALAAFGTERVSSPEAGS